MKTFDLVFFTLINTLNYLDRYLMSAALPRVTADLHLTNEQGGWLVSAFVVGYFIFSPIFGVLGDRWSRPKLMALGVFLWSLATLLCSTAETFTMFLMARMLVGVGEASFGTIAPGFLKDHYSDPVKLTRVLSFFFVAIPVGSALGYATFGIVTHFLPWPHAFLIGSLPGFILCWFILRYREPGRREVVRFSFGAGLREVARRRLLWFAIGGYVFNSFALNGVAAFVTKYGETLQFQVEEISLYFGGVLVAAGFIGTLAGGRLSATLAARSGSYVKSMMSFIAWGAAAGVPFLCAAFFVTDQTAFLALCFVAEVLIFAGTGPINSVIVTICPPQYVTLTQGLTIFAINLFGALTAPVIVGRVADKFSLFYGMQTCTVALALSAIIWAIGAKLTARLMNDERAHG